MKNLFPVVRRALCCVPAALVVAPASLLAQAQTGLLVGRVLSGDVAVPSATIIARGIGARATLTRVDGRYRMTLPAGRYSVRASRIGYSSMTDTIVIAYGATSTLNFKLQRADSPLEAVASIGARRNDRAVIDAQLPTAVYQASDLKATGRTQLSEMIQALVPGFNVSHADNAVGSASLRASSMRSMSQDEMLVLVNGRRRHSSALLNTTDALGRGTAAVDLDAIPPSMVERVEIMSGTAAQYGSGAIAGVVNVVLKSGVHGDATTTLGERKTTYNRDDGVSQPPVAAGERAATDGRVAQAAIDKGVVFGERGFLHGALEVRDEGWTNRSLPDRRSLYAPGDPRAASSPLDPARMLWLRGRPKQRDVALFLNGGNLLANGLEVYGNLGLSRRVGETSPFYVAPSGSYSYPTVFPDGYRPVFRSTSDDISGTAGVRGFLDDWTWDLGSTYGGNQLAVRGREGLNNNVITPTEEGLTGTMHDAQWTTTLDVTRIYSIFDETRFAAGGEFRADRFGVRPRESATYAPVGFQSFTQADSSHARNTLGGYMDIESDISSSLTIGLNGRVDRVSDFGTFGTGGLTARLELAPKTVLRAAASSGYHAPDLVQTHFAHAVDYLSGVRYVVGADKAASLAATPVTIEHSRNLQAGLMFEPSPALSLTLDAYRTEVRGHSTLAYYNAVDAVGVMANTMDTRTDGVTASGTQVTHLDNGGVLRLSGALDLSRVRILRADSARHSPTSSFIGILAVDSVEMTRVANGQPSSNLLFSGRYDQGMLGLLIRTQRFGGVSVGDSTTAGRLQDFGPKWITDASISLKLHRLYTFTIGADNLFDVYPDRNNQPGDPLNGVRGNDYYNILPYNPVSPFGYSGRFIYGRFSYYL